MNNKLLSLLILLGLTLFSKQATAASAETVFAEVSPSILLVIAVDQTGHPKGLGSGVVVATHEVITNCHVVQAATWVKIKKSNRFYPAQIKYRDLKRDLCLLNVPSLIAKPVPLGSVKLLRNGQKVYAIGAPEGLELSITEGIISSLRPIEGSKVIQTSVPISHGSSGGGLFDEKGRLIGITSYSLVTGQNINFALPVDWVKQDIGNAQNIHFADTRLIDEYARRIHDKIQRYTTIPSDLPGNPQARFQVILTPAGEVMVVRMLQSSGIPAYDVAVKRAIYMASPLPLPNDPAVAKEFRNFTLNFRLH